MQEALAEFIAPSFWPDPALHFVGDERMNVWIGVLSLSLSRSLSKIIFTPTENEI